MDAAENIQRLIDSLDEKELKKLAAKLELDRGANKLGLPHDAIMQLLRPSLALIRAERVYSPQRIFCLPFEDMLVNGRTTPKTAGSIDRSSIQLMWRWFTEELAKDTFPPLANAYKEAQRQGDDKATQKAAWALWKHGADLMSAVLKTVDADDRTMQTMVKKFGDENHLNDIVEMAGCLRIAPWLEKAKSDLRAKPIYELSDGEIVTVQRGYKIIEKNVPGDEIYFLLAITARLLRPSSIFQILKTLSHGYKDVLLQKTNTEIVGQIAIDELEQTAGKIKSGCAKDAFDEVAVVEDIYFFAQSFNDVTSQMGITRDGEWGQRMLQARIQVSDAISAKLLGDAEERIMLALPATAGGLAPSVTEMPSDHAFEIAERRARAIREVHAISTQLGNQSSCQAIIAKLEKYFKNYTSGLLQLLPETPKNMVPCAYAYLHIATRLVELILGSEEADLLRRRGNMALGNKMAD